VLLVLVALLAACSSPPTDPYATSNRPRRTAEAEALTKEAAELIGKDDERAEELLRDALSADLFFGPAHNNLGVLHLSRGDLYEAAHEFEWARKLMPGHPDPRLNLAITLEKAGQVEESLATYTAALEVYPDYLPAIQGLAKLTLRHGKPDARLRDWLDEIVMRTDDPTWRDWAERHRAMISR
jgi:Tfp pilus assembly protein PilF